MLTKLQRLVDHCLFSPRITAALTRGGAGAAARSPDPTRPLSWEFSGFSQNGEDGIIDYLLRQLQDPDYHFFELGSGDGLENNTSWLALTRRYSGLMVQGNSKSSRRCQRLIPYRNLGVTCLNEFVDATTIGGLVERLPDKAPDLLSLDLDGNDYHLATLFLEAGVRPKVWVVEYNAVFGPERAVTIPYVRDFDYLAAHESGLYYGASVAAWKTLLEAQGYQFVTVDHNGVNAFFLHPEQFAPEFTRALKGVQFRDNFYQKKCFRDAAEARFSRIAQLPLEEA